MRICLVYDCLFPHTVGGAERWYRNLAERLVRDGHEVTYLTLRQWDRDSAPDIEGVEVVVVGPRLALYTETGRRRIAPPIVFGLGVLWHLLRRGGRYEIVHTASFPYFSLLAAGAARLLGRYSIVTDWHEVWSDEYWLEYLGPGAGRFGIAVQRLCARIPQRAFCFSRLHAQRLREEGLRSEPTVLTGEYTGSLETPTPTKAEPIVLFAGRLIPEKRAPLAVAAIVEAARRVPGLCGVIYGDGPERDATLRAIEEHDAGEIVSAPGFVDAAVLGQEMRRALCMLLTSRREGYSMVVVEASAHATPSIVVAGEDNAATELIDEGENGFIAPQVDAGSIADAIVRVHEEGLALRERTAAWFERNAERLSLESSLTAVLESYASSSAARTR